MADVLLTGATGTLGRLIAPRLAAAGHRVRGTSRRAGAAPVDGTTMVQADVRTGAGLATALNGVDVVVHCATSPFRRSRATEVDGTDRLLRAAAASGVRHLLYVSIVGVDRHHLPYYKAKWTAEQVVDAGEVPWTILRATQFHELIDKMLRMSTTPAGAVVPRGFRFQPLAAAEAADRVVELVAAGPSGRVADLGGPEVRPLDDLTRSWLSHRGRPNRLLRLPLPTRIAADFRTGIHTCPDHADGTTTWEQWLKDQP